MYGMGFSMSHFDQVYASNINIYIRLHMNHTSFNILNVMKGYINEYT